MRGPTKLIPKLDQESTQHLNLTVLQRFDPTITDIILTASHVALYDFDINLNQWSRKEVQGSLFVVKRSKEPWYQFIVMNQNNTENLVEDLSGKFDFDLQVPYLLYRNSSQEVNGIWFYNPPECKLVADLFNRIIASYPRSISEPLDSDTSEFKELEPTPSAAVMERPLEPLPASSSVPVNVTGASEIDSISHFFNQAMHTSSSEKPLQLYHRSSEHLASLGSSSLTPTPAGILQAPSMAASNPIVHLINQHDVSDSNYRSNQISNLVTPAIFHTPHSSSSAISLPPLSSSMPPATLQPSMNLQRPYGAPILQPYPPPAPSPFLTPQSVSAPTLGPAIDRGKVREALLELAQDNQFIDMFYRALQHAHQR